MSSSLIVIRLVVTVSALIGCGDRSWEDEVGEDLRERAEVIHRESIVVDGHNDVASFWIIDHGFDLDLDGAEAEDRSPWFHWVIPWLPGAPTSDEMRTQIDFARARQGGLDAQFFSIWVSPDFYEPDDPEPGRAAARANAIIDSLYEQLRGHPDRMELALSSDDIRRIAGKGKLAALFGIEGGHAIEDDLQTLRDFYDRGVRYMTLTWSFSHNWADAAPAAGEAEPERRHGGLSPFGETVVREMNDIGMLVDVSHVSDETFWDALAVTRIPIMASHSAARALAPKPRNLSDDMLRGIAVNGGVVMINFMGMAIDRQRDSFEFILDLILHGGTTDVSISDVVDHIEHVARVAGVEHVGLGSDFDGSPRFFFPMGLRDVSDLPKLTVELLRRGYGDEEIRMILGGNLLRVLSAAERGRHPNE